MHLNFANFVYKTHMIIAAIYFVLTVHIINTEPNGRPNVYRSVVIACDKFVTDGHFLKFLTFKKLPLGVQYIT